MSHLTLSRAGLVLLVSGALLIGGCSKTEQKPTGQSALIEAKQHITLGKSLDDKKKFDEAFEEYQKALALYPDNAEVHHLLGNYHAKQRNYAEAISSFRKAIELDPTFYSSHVNLGSSLMRTGDLKGAIAIWQKAVELEPNNFAAYENLASAYIGLGTREDLKKAYEYLDQAITLQPNITKLYYTMANLLLRIEAYDEARQFLNYPLERNARDPFALEIMGKSYLLQGEREKGITFLEQALQVNPKITAPYYLLAEAYSKDPKTLDKGIELMVKVQEYDSNDPFGARLIAAKLYLFKPDWDKLKMTLEMLSKDENLEQRPEPFQAQLAYLQGRMAEQESRSADAVKHYTAANKLCEACELVADAKERIARLSK